MQISQFLHKIGGTIIHWCPACHDVHAIPVVRGCAYEKAWEWDGDIIAPTIAQSVLISSAEGFVYRRRHCHYFLKAGEIEFLPDCAHALRGLKVPLPHLPAFLRDPHA